MTLTDFTAHLILASILIIGGYQFYFWCQRNPLRPPAWRKSQLPTPPLAGSQAREVAGTPQRNDR